MQEKQIRYPLVFYPVLKQTLWGGDRIIPFLSLENEADKTGMSYSQMEHIGECWAVSAIEGFESVVSEGCLEGTSLPCVVEEFGAALLGNKNYARYGNEFPLLVKFIDAAQDLSVQVHPDDNLAALRHNCSGKTEMWYVLDAGNNARLLSGFATAVTMEQYGQMAGKDVVATLQEYNVESGDMFYLPAGTIHSIGSGAFIAEIQQSSDITYRIYDYDRKDKCGNFRELHTQQAIDAIDFDARKGCKIEYSRNVSASNNAWDSATVAVTDKHFSTQVIFLENDGNSKCGYREYGFDYSHLDSFVILTCTKGSCSLVYSDCGEESGSGKQESRREMKLIRGSVILLPADLKRVDFKVSESCELLETHI